MVTELVEVLNQHNEVVMICEHLLLVKRKNRKYPHGRNCIKRNYLGA